SGLRLPQVGIKLVKLPYFAGSPPTEIAIPGFDQIRIREFLEAAGCVESRGELVRDRFIVDKAVAVRRADGLFVQLLGVEHAPFYPGDLRAYQCGAVFKSLRAKLHPYLLLLLVRSQSLDMLPFRVARSRINGRRSRESTVKVILGHFELRGRCREQSFCI